VTLLLLLLLLFPLLLPPLTFYMLDPSGSLCLLSVCPLSGSPAAPSHAALTRLRRVRRRMEAGGGGGGHGRTSMLKTWPPSACSAMSEMAWRVHSSVPNTLVSTISCARAPAAQPPECQARGPKAYGGSG